MSPNKKIYISLIIFGAITFCFIFFVFLPAQKQIKEDSQEAFIQRQKLWALKSREASLVKLREDYRKIEPELEKIENLFLDKDYPLESLNYLEKTARDSGVKITTSALSYLKENQPWPCFSVQISLTSDFLSFIRLIDRLENSSKLLEIENPYFKKSGNQISASFLIKFYTR